MEKLKACMPPIFWKGLERLGLRQVVDGTKAPARKTKWVPATHILERAGKVGSVAPSFVQMVLITLVCASAW